jgi:hypothetical protein
MGRLRAGGVLLGFAVIACRPGSAGVSEAQAAEARGVALVELFTSEGCSSCPPADDVLNALAADARARGTPVYALAMHVDYWDSLGWPDPFASPQLTARQGDYARAFGRRGLYTPQMVVGGTEEFTGSDDDRAREAVARALARSTSASLGARVRAETSGELAVAYEARGAGAGAHVYAALVEDGLVVHVRAGENANRSLRHDGVVRSLVSSALGETARGELRLRPPAGVVAARASVVAWVDVPAAPPGQGRPVVAAVRAALPRE